MTPHQKQTIETLHEGQVGFPPMFEEADGAIGVVLVESFAAKKFGLPTEIDMIYSVVAPDGTILRTDEATYFPLRSRPDRG